VQPVQSDAVDMVDGRGKLGLSGVRPIIWPPVTRGAWLALYRFTWKGTDDLTHGQKDI